MSHGISEMEKLFSNMCVQEHTHFLFFFSNRSELPISYVIMTMVSSGAFE